MRRISLLFIFLVCITGVTHAQKFSSTPTEFVGQAVNMLKNNNAPKVGDKFQNKWGSLSADQKNKVIKISQSMSGKRLRIGVDYRDWWNAISLATERGVSGVKMDQMLDVSQKAIDSYNTKNIVRYIERLHAFFRRGALFKSKYTRLTTANASYQFAFIEGEENSNPWFKDWSEEDPKEAYDKNGDPILYAHPRVEGPVILFEKTDLYFITAKDSIGIKGTKGAFLFDKDFFVGDKGVFDWKNYSSKAVEENKDQITADMDRYSFKVSTDKLKAENVVLHYASKIPEDVKGSFEYLNKAEKNPAKKRYPIFTSYDEKYELDLKNDIKYKGGILLKNKKLFGHSKSRKAYVEIPFDGEAKLRIKSNLIQIGEGKFSSNDAAMAYYIYGDSVTHENITVSYGVSKSEGNNELIRFFKEKQNSNIPFIDQHHKFYITCDVAVYNMKSGIINFYMAGATDKVPAIFESYNYYNDERYKQLQGSLKFHPLRVIRGAGAQKGTKDIHGNTVFLSSDITEMYKVPTKTVKGMLRTLSRQGYVRYDEYSEEVTILNRTTQNDLSSNYINVIERVNKGKKLASLSKEQKVYANHDFDNMHILSLSPRNAQNDSITLDTTYFKFYKNKMQFIKLKGRNVFFTKRVFKINAHADIADTLITFKDTLRMSSYELKHKYIIEEQLERLKKHGHKEGYSLDSLYGFVVKGTRIKGKPMPNGTIDQDGALSIRGVDKFMLSDKLNVKVIPKYKEIQIFGDRVINLNEGEVTVGNFRFKGRNFILPYEEFRLTMGEIDTMLFAIKDRQDTNKIIELGAEIRLGAGELQINDPQNKSGLKQGEIPNSKGENYESYPKLTVEEGGTIYFDQYYRREAGYHRKDAYFIIPRIDIDSLTRVMPEFEGTFYSNMLPDIKEKLIPIYDPDYVGIESKYSLGFINKPKNTYKLYETGAELKTDSLVMFKTKLVASGNNSIKHLSYELAGEGFILMPDSLCAESVYAKVRKESVNGISYPEAYISDGRLKWFTTNIIESDTMALDSMTVSSKKELITIFGDKNPATLRGQMSITPKAFWGTGTLLRKDFFVLAPIAMKITATQIKTPELIDNIVDFKINSIMMDPFDEDALNVYAENPAILQGSAVNIDFNIVAGECKISPNKHILEMDNQYSFIVFPYAQFKTSISEAYWNLKNKVITMSGDTTSFFKSTKYEEDGEEEKDIFFHAKGGTYDIKNLDNPLLDLYGVPYITSSDALILPDSNLVSIKKGANIEKLINAKMVIDTLNAYHNLFDANIKINDRLSFEGDAHYRYVNQEGDTTNIKFDSFETIEEKLETKRRRDKEKVLKYTSSKAHITEENKMMITSRIQFKGSIEMKAYRKDLYLDGFIKLNLESQKNFENWIPYKSDTSTVSVDITESMEMDGHKLTSGLHFDPVERTLYTTFLSPAKQAADQDLFHANGHLSYNPDINEFKISPLDKETKKEIPGNRFIFDDAKGIVYLEGKLDMFDAVTTPYISTYTLTKADIKGKTFDFDNLMAFSFPKPSSAFSKMAENFVMKKGSASKSLQNDTHLDGKIRMLASPEKLKEFHQTLLTEPVALHTLTKVLNKSIVLSKVNLKWSEKEKAYYSVGKIGVSNFNNKEVNLELDGMLEIQKIDQGADIINLYLRASDEAWFYLSFQNTALTFLSSSKSANKAFEKGKISTKENTFGYIIAEADASALFKRRFKKTYLGMKDAAISDNDKAAVDVMEESDKKKDDEKEKKKDDEKDDTNQDENGSDKEEKPKKKKSKKEPKVEEDKVDNNDDSDKEEKPKKKKKKKSKKEPQAEEDAPKKKKKSKKKSKKDDEAEDDGF